MTSAATGNQRDGLAITEFVAAQSVRYLAMFDQPDVAVGDQGVGVAAEWSRPMWVKTLK